MELQRLGGNGRRYGIALVLGTTMVGLVGLAVALVLAIQFFVAGSAATALFRANGNQLVERMVERVQARLEPAAELLAFVAEMLAQPDATDSERRIADVLTGALAGTANIERIIFVSPAYRAIVVDRGETAPEIRIVDVRNDANAVAGIAEGRAVREGRPVREGWAVREGRWGELLFLPRLAGPAVNRRQTVWQGERFAGILAAIVPLQSMSAIIENSAAAEYGGTPFILYGNDAVLAHARLPQTLSGLSPEHPLPNLAEIGDPVLASMWTLRNDAPLLRDSENSHMIEYQNERYLFLYRQLNEFGDVPWIVGAHFPARDIAGNLRSLAFAAFAGLGVLGLAVVAAFLLARRLALPTQRSAAAAAQLAELDFGRAQALPPSRIRELDEQAEAFNRLIAALRWFEAYVPRKLVRVLARDRDGTGIASQTREVTVMFSDIVGFTTRSQNMTPAETATLLNSHFALAIAAIEASGGTVDKFMGDGIMAFWGAPEPLPNHAKAALAAARAIAASASQADVRLRLGLHTGLVVAGNVGSALRLNYTILGDTVNAAHRIEELGHALMQAGDTALVLASEATYASAGSPADFDLAGEFTLRGRAERVSIYRLRADADAPQAP
ncbi:MAG: adenylate/guanylate cyclase domain-containing protein [Telmatospirillum sp.]|nr:adenylate/guanylate cyclase domain-containing protein [Telmatospirillum sp.]